MGKIRHKIMSLVVISRTFPSKFQLISIISVSGYCVHFTFKTCQIVSGKSMTCQFHEFLNLFFGGFLQFGSTMRCLCTVLLPLCCHGPQCTLLQGDVKIKILQSVQCSLAQPWWILTFIFAQGLGRDCMKLDFFSE